MYKGLREYIDYLERMGELIRIQEFTDPVYEIAEITDRVSKMPGGGKALLFENTGTAFPVLTNMIGSEKRILYALGIGGWEEISRKIDRLMQQAVCEKPTLMSKLKLLPTLKEAAGWLPKEAKGVPPCQEVVMAAPDLSRLPVLKCWPYDGGRFITFPLVHTQDPKTGVRNVGMYRMQVFTENTTGMHWHRHKTGARHYEEWPGGRMPVAVCLGGDPVYTYAATAPLPDGLDEYLFAGFIRGKGVELAPCLTQDLKVPADCDFVLEGYIDTNEPKVMEGPFGDHTGFYSPQDLYPRFHITAVTHRKDAVYPATVVGIPPQEDKYIALATEKIFLSPIQYALAPEITDLYLPEEGVGHNFAVVKIRKRYPGQAVKIAHALWGAGQMMFNKMLFITDDKDEEGKEIDIRDPEVLRRTAVKNYRPKRDTYFSRGPLDILDHAAPTCGFGGKMCLDATRKLSEETSRIRSENVSPARFISFIHPSDPVPADTLIAVIIDPDNDKANLYRNLWLAGNNIDPIRDSSFAECGTAKILVLDARTKAKDAEGMIRDWPAIAESSPETVRAVSEKWNKYRID